MEGEEEFLPRLKCLIGGEIPDPLGPIIWKGAGIEEGGCGNSRGEILQEGEAGAHRFLMGVLKCVEVLQEAGVLPP